MTGAAPKESGFVHALAASVVWGLLPIYWKWLKAVPPLQLLAHRIVWSFVLLVVVRVTTRTWGSPRTLELPVIRSCAVSAVLIGINWLTYIWAVNAGYIVETSLGYFISPLLNVLLGVVVFRERLRPMQWVPVALATIGVVYLTIGYGTLPWIALTLAGSFGLYGWAKKILPIGSISGLTVETGMLLLPAVGYLIACQIAGTGAFAHVDAKTDILLIGAGTATTLPLLMFATAARRVRLSVLGLVQYVAPTLQLLLGVLVYRESFPSARAIGFGLVWLGLFIFVVEAHVASRAMGAPQTSAREKESVAKS